MFNLIAFDNQLGIGILFEGTTWLIAFKELKKGKYIKGRNFLRAVHSSKDPAVLWLFLKIQLP